MKRFVKFMNYKQLANYIEFIIVYMKHCYSQQYNTFLYGIY